MGKHLLVTGARGLVGADIVARLARMGHAVVALVRTDGEIVTSDGGTVPSTVYGGALPGPGEVTRIAGDISRERLGLSQETYDVLRGWTDLIAHCAATTSFGLAPEKYEINNTRGTHRMLELALGDGGRMIPFLYTSTAYVAGERPGAFREGDLELNQTFGNDYEASKYRAEQAVRAAMRRGLPAVVVRPGIIVGDSKTGAISKFDTLYSVMRLTTAGLVRTLPGDYGATLDVVSIDWVADGIVAAIEALDRAAGRTLHLVSDTPITLKDLNGVCAEFPSFHVARYVPRHLFDLNALGTLERRYYQEVVSLYESYYHRKVRFVRGPTTTEIWPEPPRTSGKALLRTIFSYALKVGYFGRR